MNTIAEKTIKVPSRKPAGVLAKIFHYELSDVIRGKGIIGYALFFFAITETLIRLSGGAKALLSLMNVVLIVTPLVCVLFGAIYLYNARDFIEMLLVQPVNRKQMFGGLYLGLSVPLALGFVMGVSLPFLFHRQSLEGFEMALAVLLLCGVLLTFVFVAIAFFIVTIQDDKARGLSAAFMTWFMTGVVYDGIVLLLIQGFAAYPLEVPTLVLAMLNPVDLGRILLMLNFDIAAMMGYTGAVFETFFGSSLGMILTTSILLLWIAIPLGLGYRKFLKKDF